IVVTAAPSAWAASMVHDFTDSPSTSTVHAPHDDVSQPILVPVSAQASRRYCTSSMRGSTSCSCEVPLTVIPTLIGGNLAGDGGAAPGHGHPEQDAAFPFHRGAVVVPIGMLARNPAVVVDETFHRLGEVHDLGVPLDLHPLAEEAVVEHAQRDVRVAGDVL